MGYTTFSVLVERLINVIEPKNLTPGQIAGILNQLKELRSQAPRIASLIAGISDFEYELEHANQPRHFDDPEDRPEVVRLAQVIELAEVRRQISRERYAQTVDIDR